MSLSSEQIEIIADKYLVGLFQELEKEVITDIAKRVKKTGRFTESAELLAKSMREQGFSTTKIQKEVMKLLKADEEYKKFVAENTKEYKQFVKERINETVEQAKIDGNKMVAEAGNMAFNDDLSMWKKADIDLKKPNNLTQLINSFYLQTNGEIKNISRSLGFKNTANGYTNVINMYQKELDLSIIKVATGTFSFDDAVNNAISNMAKNGLKSIDYASGRSYHVDTAVRMSVRTGCSQLAGKITEQNIKNTGVDLVITSQHAGCRDSHRSWQNQIFSYDGKSKKYPDFVSSTGYGTAGGLKGVNCTHNFYPYFEGISVMEKDVVEPSPKSYNGKEYEFYQATQKQREMERNIRATKREIYALQSVGENTTVLEKKLKLQNKEYKDFSTTMDIRPKQNRLKVIN